MSYFNLRAAGHTPTQAYLAERGPWVILRIPAGVSWSAHDTKRPSNQYSLAKLSSYDLAADSTPPLTEGSSNAEDEALARHVDPLHHYLRGREETAPLKTPGTVRDGGVLLSTSAPDEFKSISQYIGGQFLLCPSAASMGRKIEKEPHRASASFSLVRIQNFYDEAHHVIQSVEPEQHTYFDPERGAAKLSLSEKLRWLFSVWPTAPIFFSLTARGAEGSNASSGGGSGAAGTNSTSQVTFASGAGDIPSEEARSDQEDNEGKKEKRYTALKRDCAENAPPEFLCVVFVGDYPLALHARCVFRNPDIAQIFRHMVLVHQRRYHQFEDTKWKQISDKNKVKSLRADPVAMWKAWYKILWPAKPIEEGSWYYQQSSSARGVIPALDFEAEPRQTSLADEHRASRLEPTQDQISRAMREAIAEPSILIAVENFHDGLERLRRQQRMDLRELNQQFEDAESASVRQTDLNQRQATRKRAREIWNAGEEKLNRDYETKKAELGTNFSYICARSRKGREYPLGQSPIDVLNGGVSLAVFPTNIHRDPSHLQIPSGLAAAAESSVSDRTPSSRSFNGRRLSHTPPVTYAIDPRIINEGSPIARRDSREATSPPDYVPGNGTLSSVARLKMPSAAFCMEQNCHAPAEHNSDFCHQHLAYECLEPML